MRFSDNEIKVLNSILKKIEEDKKKDKIRISQRRKSQIKGKTINRQIQKKNKPIKQNRKSAKKRSSIR